MTLKDKKVLLEARIVAEAIIEMGGVCAAAEKLSIHRNSVYRKLALAEIRAPFTIGELRRALYSIEIELAIDG